MSRKALPDHLKDERHLDWPWPLSYIPRSWTSFKWGVPKKIIGSQKDTKKDKNNAIGPAPIGEPGSWQISRYPNAPFPLNLLPLYGSYSGKRGSDGMYRASRLGMRWDDVDDYTALSIASRKYTGDDSQITEEYRYK